MRHRDAKKTNDHADDGGHESPFRVPVDVNREPFGFLFLFSKPANFIRPRQERSGARLFLLRGRRGGDGVLLDLLDQRNSSAVQKVPFSVSRGSPERGLLTRATEIIAMKLIDVVPAARVIIAATICVVAGSANAQQIGSVQEGRRLAREVCAECHAIDNAASGSTNPNAPTFKVIANTPGMTSAALTVALQTTHVTMPNFVIKGDALQNIIAYILSLKEKN